ncbi:MAG: hypothetical protein QM627_05255 [Luteolibacter sp.]
MKRIHIPNMGPDQANIPKAIAVGIRECKSSTTDVLALITPVKDNFDSIVVGEFLGNDVSKRLMKGGHVPIQGQGISLSHHSVSTVQKGRTPKVGIAFYVSSSDIKKLDDLQFDCLIFVPWLDKDGEQWARIWDAETHGGTTVGAAVNLHTEVEKALSDLTACVNLSTGLGHPSDKEHAKRKFSQLRSAGITWDPSEIEKWAVRNRWKVSDAQELATLSSKYT